jgi:23S rRNA pseudouridine1911/1915/1917 synthase
VNSGYEFVVAEEEVGLRLDQYLVARRLPQTRSQIKRMLKRGAGQVNGEPARPSRRLRQGDTVCFTPPPPPPSRALPEQIPLWVLYEDGQLIVVDKPPGMVVHPAAGHSSGTLVNALLGHCGRLPDAGDPFRPGIVHRLDRHTSGVLVATRTPEAQAHLGRQFSEHTVERRYWAAVAGELLEPGTFDTLHGRHPRDRKRFSSRVSRGRRAVTHYRPLQPLQGATLVEATLETGRTHQVRVHFADAGHPVLGDPLYGRAPAHPGARAAGRRLGRQALHAHVLGFDHPRSGQRLRFATPPPADMLRLIDELSPAQGG